MPESILIVEDKPALQDTLTYNLKKEGYTVKTTGNILGGVIKNVHQMLTIS